MEAGCGSGARLEHLRHAQDGADAVGELVIIAGEDAVEERLGGGPFAARIQEEAELGGGEQIGGRVRASMRNSASASVCWSMRSSR